LQTTHPTSQSKRVLHKDYKRKGSLAKKKSVVVNLKGLGAETNLLAVNFNCCELLL
jgi:hypothetical protein